MWTASGATTTAAKRGAWRVHEQQKHGRKQLLRDIRELEAHGIHVKYQRPPWYLIDPRPGSPAAGPLGVWDAVSIVTLLFTAIFTPYEVAFLATAPLTECGSDYESKIKQHI